MEENRQYFQRRGCGAQESRPERREIAGRAARQTETSEARKPKFQFQLGKRFQKFVRHGGHDGGCEDLQRHTTHGAALPFARLPIPSPNGQRQRCFVKPVV